MFTQILMSTNKMSRRVCVLSSNLILPIFFHVSAIFRFGIDVKSCVSADNCGI